MRFIILFALFQFVQYQFYREESRNNPLKFVLLFFKDQPSAVHVLFLFKDFFHQCQTVSHLFQYTTKNQFVVIFFRYVGLLHYS